jgi:large subunit ribosomal protein L6
MSRIGRAPIAVPSDVEFTYDNALVTVKGPKGELMQRVPRQMTVQLEDGVIKVTRPTDSGPHRSLHGLTRTLIANMVEGVTKGFERRLEIVGVGYRASVKGASLELLVGYSHPVLIEPPEGIEFETPQPQVVLVRGIDKQVVGQTAATIRAIRPPEPYKGKGIRYAGEFVQRKVGKRA